MLRGRKTVSLVEEKAVVVILILLTALRQDALVFKATKEIEPSLLSVRELVRELPPQKLILPINVRPVFYGQIGVGSHVEYYYVTEGKGLAPGKWPVDFNTVKYRKTHPWAGPPKVYDRAVLGHYDFLLVWGDNPKVEGILRDNGFVVRRRTGQIATYEKG